MGVKRITAWPRGVAPPPCEDGALAVARTFRGAQDPRRVRWTSPRGDERRGRAFDERRPVSRRTWLAACRRLWADGGRARCDLGSHRGQPARVGRSTSLWSRRQARRAIGTPRALTGGDAGLLAK